MSATITRQQSFTRDGTIQHHDLGGTKHCSPSHHMAQQDTPRIRRIEHKIVGKVSNMLSVTKTARQNGKWCFINAFLAMVFYFQLFQFSMETLLSLQSSMFPYIDFILTLIFSWNVLTNLYLYCLPSFKQCQVVISSKQKTLLGLTQENEKLFRVEDESVSPKESLDARKNSYSPTSYPVRRLTSKTPSGVYGHSSNKYSPHRINYSPSRDPTPLASRGSSQQFVLDGNQTSFSPDGSNTPIMSGHSNSILSTPSPSVFLNSSPSPTLRQLQLSPGRTSSHGEQMLDYSAMEKYIEKEEEMEQRNRRGQHSSPKSQSIWMYGRSAYDFIPNYGTYQLATRSKTPNVQDGDDMSDSPYKNDEILRKLNLQRRDVDVWNENFRKWFAQTVLEPLVKEINTINNKLIQMGSQELQIGTISHSSLQSLFQTKSQHLPSLQAVIPYLDVTTNQEYLVSRLKELETGGCLRLYRWDGGGSYKNKQWNPDLPTDAQILCHLFCSYMDTHLPSNPRYPDGKSFTGLHFLKTPSKPCDKKSSLSLYQSHTQKPHFKVLVEDDVYDMPRGRNNLFCAMVIFLYFAKRNLHGMLERVNLGMSGINVLWILNK